MAPLTILSGGQTGADRAALDAAIATGLPYGGWCPAGGWAEDLPEPPGLLARYPLLRSTPSADPAVRTELNVRESDATLILGQGPVQCSGTMLTLRLARASGRPHCLLEPGPAAVATARQWLGTLGGIARLNIAGPRESNCPGLYAVARPFLERLFATLGTESSVGRR